jgi:hypothetical protein
MQEEIKFLSFLHNFQKRKKHLSQQIKLHFNQKQMDP